MKNQTLAMAADQTLENYGKPTRRDEFLKTMEVIVRWAALCEVIEPHYPKAGNGRPPIGLKRMLRIHFIQHWFNLTDLACEEALYDSASLRRFVGVDLGCEPAHLPELSSAADVLYPFDERRSLLRRALNAEAKLLMKRHPVDSRLV